MCVGPNLRDEDVHMVVEQTIKEADTIDNDGRISREEFSQVRHPPTGCGFGFGFVCGRSVSRVRHPPTQCAFGIGFRFGRGRCFSHERLVMHISNNETDTTTGCLLGRHEQEAVSAV
jgi:hypothetical protein